MSIEDSITTIEETEKEIILHIELQDANPDDVSLDVNEEGVDVIIKEDAYAHIPVTDLDVSNMEALVEHDHLDLIIPKEVA